MTFVYTSDIMTRLLSKHVRVCFNYPLTVEVPFVVLQDFDGFDTRWQDWSAPFTAHEFAKS